MVIERKICPDVVGDTINEFINTLDEIGYFTSPEIPEGYSENCKSHVWNVVSDIFIPQFLNGEDLFLAEGDLEMILHKGIVYSCLDSLVDDGSVDTIENEEGENVFWLTKKGEENVLKYLS